MEQVVQPGSLRRDIQPPHVQIGALFRYRAPLYGYDDRRIHVPDEVSRYGPAGRFVADRKVHDLGGVAGKGFHYGTGVPVRNVEHIPAQVSSALPRAKAPGGPSVSGAPAAAM